MKQVVLTAMAFAFAFYGYCEVRKVSTNTHVLCYETPMVCIEQTVGDTIICNGDTMVCIKDTIEL